MNRPLLTRDASVGSIPPPRDVPWLVAAARSHQRLINAAIALVRSEAGTQAKLSGQPNADALYEPWAEMDELVAALDKARPGWREAPPR